LSNAARALTHSESGNVQHNNNPRSDGNNVAKKGVPDHHHSNTKPHSKSSPQQQSHLQSKHQPSKGNPAATTLPSTTNKSVTHHQTLKSSSLDEPDTKLAGPGRETGAIMKQKVKQRQAKTNHNHLDEILALPMDDQ